MATKTVGVLVARFQGHRLHEGWRRIIDHVIERHPEHALIVLGVHGGERTAEDPLTFQEREHMVREAYPSATITIQPLNDHQISSAYWSESLDALIRATFPGCDATLYGSRDSFIPHYSGTFPVLSVTHVAKVSGTEQRREARSPTTEAGREAIIHALQKRRKIVYSAVDIAILDLEEERVLLISKKKWAGRWAFPGGFAEPDSLSDRDDALREQTEEVLGVRVGNFACITPERLRVDDPRYRKSRDGIRTSLYVTHLQSGMPVGGDDAETARWFSFHAFEKMLVPWHKPLGTILQAYLRR